MPNWETGPQNEILKNQACFESRIQLHLTSAHLKSGRPRPQQTLFMLLGWMGVPWATATGLQSDGRDLSLFLREGG